MKPEAAPVAQGDDEEVEEEIRAAEMQPQVHDENEEDQSDSGDDLSDYASDASHTPKKRKTRHQESKADALVEPAEKASKEGVVKTVVRKIKATAHANYRKLKIRGNGTTGKGRFGRRR